MNLGQTYKVKRNDETCFEGGIDELKAWLRDKRISSDDEIKKNGYVVLEGEELWSLVKDRSELGFNPVHERAQIRKIRVSLMWLSGIAALSLIAAGCLFYINFITPAIEVHEISKRLDAENAERIRQLDDRLQATLAKAQVEMKLTQSRLDEIARRIPKLGEGVQTAAQIATKAELEAIRADAKRILDWYETRISKIEKAQQTGVAPNSQVVISNKSGSPRSVLDYLSVSWSYANPGLRYLTIDNTSGRDLTVVITRTDGKQRVPFKVTIPAGRTYNSGVEDSLTDSSGGLKAFDAGDNVTLSLSVSNFEGTIKDANLEVK